MFKFRKIFVTSFTLCLLVSGCNGLDEGVKDLPENKKGEVSHNTYDDKSSFLREQEPATLDEGYISQYIDVNEFGNESAWVQDNSFDVNNNFTLLDDSISNDIEENKKEYNKQKDSVDSDTTKMKNNNASSYNTDINELNNELNDKESEYNEKIEEFTSESD